LNEGSYNLCWWTYSRDGVELKVANARMMWRLINTNINSQEEMTYICNSMIKGRNSICPSYKICHMEMNEDKVYKIRLWSKVFQFAYQDIRITGSFQKLEKILAMPTYNFNVSSIEESTSSIEITSNKYSQIQNSKGWKKYKMHCETREIGNPFH
jgi:hypothetical protein